MTTQHHEDSSTYDDEVGSESNMACFWASAIGFTTLLVTTVIIIACCCCSGSSDNQVGTVFLVR